jgi:hypothetical protein
MLYLGKLPATPENVALEFHDYANISLLAAPPDSFGHEKLVPNWGMLGNDQACDCYVAGTGHQIMLWTAEGGEQVPISTATAIKYYQELTLRFNGEAYDPSQTDPATGENPTDTGISISQALPLLRSVGMPDDTGRRHTIGAYVKLRPGNWEQLRYGTYYFDGVGMGVQMCQEWMDSFQQTGKTVWDAVKNPTWIGGHYISAMAWRDGNVVDVSWGEPVEITQAGYEMAGLSDETYAYVSKDKLKNGVDLEGLDLAKMNDDLKQLPKVA